MLQNLLESLELFQNLWENTLIYSLIRCILSSFIINNSLKHLKLVNIRLRRRMHIANLTILLRYSFGQLRPSQNINSPQLFLIKMPRSKLRRAWRISLVDVALNGDLSIAIDMPIRGNIISVVLLIEGMHLDLSIVHHKRKRVFNFCRFLLLVFVGRVQSSSLLLVTVEQGQLRILLPIIQGRQFFFLLKTTLTNSLCFF